MQYRFRAIGRQPEDRSDAIQTAISGGSIEAAVGVLHQSGGRYGCIQRPVAPERIQHGDRTFLGDLKHRAVVMGTAPGSRSV